MSERLEITFSEGGVGLIETLATGGLAVVAEKTMDAVSGNDNHGWYCTIRDTVTQISVKCWGPTEEEAEAKSREELKRKIEEAELRKRNEQKREPPSKTPTTPSTPSTDENGCLKIVVYIVLVIGAIALAVWLAVNIVLPVTLLNSALIFAILALIFKQQKILFAILALLGGGYLMLDILNGWLSLSFIENVVKDSTWISVFVYINAIALGIATYLLVKPIWGNAMQIDDIQKGKSLLLKLLMIFLIAIGVLAMPLIYQFIEKPLDSINISSNRIGNSDSFVLENGVSVIIEVSVADLIKDMSSKKTNEVLIRSIHNSVIRSATSAKDLITLFGEEVVNLNQIYESNIQLSELFSGLEFSDKTGQSYTNEEILRVIRQKCNVSFDRTVDVLNNRFKVLGFSQINIHKLNNFDHIQIEIPDIPYSDRIKKIIEEQFEVEFWETYSLNELSETLTALNELTEDLKTLFEIPTFNKYIQLIEPIEGNTTFNALVGLVAINDTSKMNKILQNNKCRQLLPFNLKMTWAAKPNMNKPDLLELYALKVTSKDGSPAMNSDAISVAKQVGNKKEKSKVVISMNENGKKTWQKLINRNIGKQIAIVIDGVVYSTTNIETKTKCDRCEITGNFSKEEAKELASLLNADKLPCPVRIIKVDEVGNCKRNN